MFFAACEGYFDKLDDEAALFRNLAVIVHRTMGGKGDIEKVWQLHNDPKPEIMQPWTKEEIEEMTKKANEKFRNARNERKNRG